MKRVMSERKVNLILNRSKSVEPARVESKELLNATSIEYRSKKVLATAFNYRTARSESHLKDSGIEEEFVNSEFFQNFADQHKSWSDIEFKRNNISQKSSIVTNARLIRSQNLGENKRVWVYKAKLPVLNRAVKQNGRDVMEVTLRYVYLGLDGGSGVYQIQLKRVN